MKENIKTIIFSVSLTILLIIVAISVTYAFFLNKINNESEVKISTEITNQAEVIYNPGDSIILKNAEPGASQETIFDISIKASNKTKDTIIYGINWVIDINTYEYESLNPNIAQLAYSLYYSKDKEIWTPFIENQDCTTWLGTKILASDQELSAESNTQNTIYWKFKIEYKTYNFNQISNMNKEISGMLQITGLE